MIIEVARSDERLIADILSGAGCEYELRSSKKGPQTIRISTVRRDGAFVEKIVRAPREISCFAVDIDGEEAIRQFEVQYKVRDAWPTIFDDDLNKPGVIRYDRLLAKGFSPE